MKVTLGTCVQLTSCLEEGSPMSSITFDAAIVTGKMHFGPKLKWNHKLRLTHFSEMTWVKGVHKKLEEKWHISLTK